MAKCDEIITLQTPESCKSVSKDIEDEIQTEKLDMPAVKISETTKFHIHAFIVWALVCLPSNIVTLVMFEQTGTSVASSKVKNQSDDFKEQNATLRTFDINRALLLDEFCTNVLHLMSPKKSRKKASQNDELIAAFINCTLYSETDIEQPLQYPVRRACGIIEDLTIEGQITFTPIVECIKHKQHEISAMNFQCYESLVKYGPIRQNFKFWLEGVGITCVGIFGLIANILTFIVLKDIKTNTNFNKLLISLAFVDSLLIFDMLVEKALIGVFLGEEEPLWYKLTFPYFWFPIKGMIFTATIFMLVAVSAERYRAVCHPMAKRQNAYQFILFVAWTSITLDIPRFFHFKLDADHMDYWTTELYENPSYIQFVSYWDELIVTGFAPLVALFYYNIRIYLKIRASSKFEYRFVGGGNRRHTKTSTTENPTTCQTETNHRSKYPGVKKRSEIELGEERNLEKKLTQTKAQINGMNDQQDSPEPSEARDMETILIEGCSPEDSSVHTQSNTNRHVQATPASSFGQSIQCGQTQKKSRWYFSPKRFTANRPPIAGQCSNTKQLRRFSQVRMSLIHANKLISPKPSKSQNGECREMRKRREKSTIILVTIVLLFIGCHSYRLALKVYEFINPDSHTMTSFNHCYQMDRHHVPVISYVLHNIHYLFLVANSSVNFVVYCCVGRDFKTRMLTILGQT